MNPLEDQVLASLPEDYNEASGHSFCVLPWLHRFVNLGGEVQLCCVAEEFNHSYIREDSNRPSISATASVTSRSATRGICVIFACRCLKVTGQPPANVAG